MKPRRIWILVKNEILHGPKDTVLVMAVVMPILLTLFINLAFGNIFTQKSRLGIYDEGNSALTGLLKSDSGIIVKVYRNETQLKSAASRGSVDAGLILPADFDSQIRAGEVNLTTYIWGESQAKTRTLIPAALDTALHQMQGSPLPAEIASIPLGAQDSQPWKDRLLPIAIMMAVFLGGLMIPASSLINEKIHRTLQALNVTPASVLEIFSAKGIIGIVLGALMGILTLLISGGLNSTFPAVLLMLLLGGIMAAELGLIAGALIKDLNTLYAFWKFGALLLFGPALVYVFPQIPQWIGYLFPTYYVIRPIVELSLNGASLQMLVLFPAVAAGLIILLFIFLTSLIRHLNNKAVAT